MLNIKFDSEPIYSDNDKYIKIKIKSYRDQVNTNFQSNEISKEDASKKCLSLIMLDFVIRASKMYYLQTLLEECKCRITRNKVENLFNNDLESSSSDESDNEFNNGPVNGSEMMNLMII